MRKVEFNELKVKNKYNKQEFYDYYVKNLPQSILDNSLFGEPQKTFEIIIFDGKILLLKTGYIKKEEKMNQKVFYNYDIAYQVYKLILDIQSGIEDEKNEFNELYKNERLEKDAKIQELMDKDNQLFEKAVQEYNIILNSSIYKEYLILKEENKELIEINKKLNEKINKKNSVTNKVNSFWTNIKNKINNNKLLSSGEENDKKNN